MHKIACRRSDDCSRWRFRKSAVGRFLRGLLNLNSHNQNQRGRRRRFYLAVQTKRPTSAPRYDISLRRNRAPHVSGPTIPLRTDRSPTHRPTADALRALSTTSAIASAQKGGEGVGNVGKLGLSRAPQRCALRPVHSVKRLLQVPFGRIASFQDWAEGLHKGLP